MFVSAARDYFKEHLSLGDHWAGGIRKQNLTKNPLSTVNFISTKGRDGRKRGKNGPSAEHSSLTLQKWMRSYRKKEGREEEMAWD